MQVVPVEEPPAPGLEAGDEEGVITEQPSASEGRDGAGQYSSFNCPAALCYCAQPGHRYEGWLVVCEREAGRIRAVSVPKHGAPAAGEMPFVAQGKALGAA